MSIWQRLSGQNRKKKNHKNSQNYEHESMTQSITTQTNSGNSQTTGDNNKIKIIIDDPAEEDALDFQRYSQNLANIIKGTEPKFAVGIFGKWGTGKTTLMRMIKRELDKDSDKILTVWFDAWRYEREKHLAVIPFLRQIRIALDNDLAKHRKTERWDKLKDGLESTFTAFMESTQLSVSIPGSPASPTINLGTFVSSLKSKGSANVNGERIQFHEHATDHLREALEILKNPKSGKGNAKLGTRIVVFVDDLDRCSPEKAVEVLESIKAFFDIDGIVYVVGMDSVSIDYIIKQKYGENSEIKGLDYLQKIVQLPFQIPVWNRDDIVGSIEKIITKGLEGSELVGEFLDPARKELIVNAVEPNPRQVKRFVNNIILAKAVFSKPGKDIEIDKLIAVQALNFRPEWNKFLELITTDRTRKSFFDDYYISLKSKGKEVLDRFIDELDKFVNTGKTPESEGLVQADSEPKVPLPIPREIIGIFKELKIPANFNLRSFLYAGADEILRDIDRMEDYRRALEATKLKEGPTKEFLLELLRTGRVKEFNEVRTKYPISPDISFANLSGANLSGANFSYSSFSGSFNNVDFVGANLSYSLIAGADFYFSNFSAADLSNIEVGGGDDPFARFIDANFRNARFFDANISYCIFARADFYGADLSGANLSYSDFTGAKLGKVIVNDKTRAEGIRLTSKEEPYDIFEEKAALEMVDESLRRIIVRDNPTLQ
jgi:hypothetical protein